MEEDAFSEKQTDFYLSTNFRNIQIKKFNINKLT